MRALVIDELHNLLAGRSDTRREFLNVLRYLGNQLRIPLVGVGTQEAYLAIRSDEQGTIQGALTSIMSLTGVFGPVIGTTVFAYFTSPDQAVHVPGAPFFLGAGLTVIALFFTVRTLQQFPKKAAAVPNA